MSRAGEERALGEVVLTVNSPGEVATWLVPVVRALRARAGEGAALTVTVMVLPCMYAAGTELTVVRGVPGVDQAFGPRESLLYALSGIGLKTWRPQPRGAVVYLGGELALASLIAGRLGYRALMYTEGRHTPPKRFERIFVPNERARQSMVQRGADPARVQVVGDLMVDAAHLDVHGDATQIRAAWGLNPARKTVALFPGSRPYELRRAGRLMVAAAAHMLRREPQVQFVLAVAPFHTEAGLRKDLAEFAPRFTGDPARLFAAEGIGAAPRERVERFSFETDQGTVPILFVRGGERRVIAAADLALTIPGSNTMEMAAHGVPMVVCLPLDHLEEIPIDGVLGLLGGIPLVGRPLKRAAVKRVLERTRFTALPNRSAGKMLVPELRSERLSPADVAEAALRLLADDARRAALSQALREVAGPAGASGRVADAILTTLSEEGG